MRAAGSSAGLHEIPTTAKRVSLFGPDGRDKQKPGTAMCVGCGSQIHDQFILRVSPDLEWHASCLKCAECSQYLDETCTCFVRDGKTYCKRDYVSRQLLPGDEFSLREHELLCRADHGLLLERPAAGSPRSPGPLPGARGLHLSDPGSGRQPSLRPHVHKQTEKTTRVRTVLNEKQLHTLRTCYAANPRPDALMKEQLVEMTGLSPRVIRVWFQNKRCKDKKKSILMKQLQQQQHNDKTPHPRGPASPIRHESAVQGSAVEVQTYQPPWKALSEFALQSDLDQPAFQQLGSAVEVQTYQPPWKALSEFALQSDLDQPAFQQLVSFSESGSLGNSSGSDVTSLSSQLPDTPNSMVPSPVETAGRAPRLEGPGGSPAVGRRVQEAEVWTWAQRGAGRVRGRRAPDCGSGPGRERRCRHPVGARGDGVQGSGDLAAPGGDSAPGLGSVLHAGLRRLCPPCSVAPSPRQEGPSAGLSPPATAVRSGPRTSAEPRCRPRPRPREGNEVPRSPGRSSPGPILSSQSGEVAAPGAQKPHPRRRSRTHAGPAERAGSGAPRRPGWVGPGCPPQPLPSARGATPPFN
ncbi:Insulin enhancer protein ISL-2 [Tupaia chinensis]|uniref:Insulin enhancer protein ISL-2 n=1 Tax=Tupaia chinensis TaxID=246437 RepID=L9L6Q7_TUPCH|nr:Insulin enhancer protein ISL-2 [Tupaia chinensis]